MAAANLILPNRAAAVPERLAALTIDALLTSAVTGLALWRFGLGWDIHSSGARYLPVLVVALNKLLLASLHGGSAGKLAMHLRVVDAGTGRPVRLVMLCAREWTQTFIWFNAVVFWHGPLWLQAVGAGLLAYDLGYLFVDPRHRALHDRSAGAIVVRLRGE